MTRIEFYAEGEPKGQPRPRAFARRMGGKYVARVYDAGTAEGWKSCVAMAAKPCAPSEPLAGPLRLQVRFDMPRPKGHYGSGKNAGIVKQQAPAWHIGKPDPDNLAKAVMDALTQLGVWRDDSQVVELNVSKRYAARGGAFVVIEEAAPNRA